MCATVIPMMNCPNRPTGGPWTSWGTSYFNVAATGQKPPQAPAKLAPTDYACNISWPVDAEGNYDGSLHQTADVPPARHSQNSFIFALKALDKPYPLGMMEVL